MPIDCIMGFSWPDGGKSIGKLPTVLFQCSGEDVAMPLHMWAIWWRVGGPMASLGLLAHCTMGVCVCRWQWVGNAMGHVGNLVASWWPDGVIWVRWPIAMWVCAGGNVLVVRPAFGEHVGWACGPFMYCAIGLPF